MGILKIKKLPVGELKANCYLVWDEESREGIVIDPGDEGEFISEEIMRERITVKTIFLTHGHFDHVQAVLEVKLNYQAPILMNKNDERIYMESGKSRAYWTGQEGLPMPKVDQWVKNGDSVKFGAEIFEVIETPGHTPGSVCLYSKKRGVLFSGDVLFKNGIGRVDFSYSDPKAMRVSLVKLSKLPEETKVMPGHGEETTIGDEVFNSISVFKGNESR